MIHFNKCEIIDIRDEIVSIKCGDIRLSLSIDNIQVALNESDDIFDSEYFLFSVFRHEYFFGEEIKESIIEIIAGIDYWNLNRLMQNRITPNLGPGVYDSYCLHQANHYMNKHLAIIHKIKKDLVSQGWSTDANGGVITLLDVDHNWIMSFELDELTAKKENGERLSLKDYLKFKEKCFDQFCHEQFIFKIAKEKGISSNEDFLKLYEEYSDANRIR